MLRLLRLLTVATVALATVACTSDGTAAPTTAPATVPPTGATLPVTAAPTTPLASTTTTAIPPTTRPTTPPTTAPTAAPTTAAPSSPAPDTSDVRVYFLRGERLVVAHRDVAGPAVLRGAIEALLDGPVGGDTTAIPAGTVLRGVNLVDGEATVDLTDEFATGGGSLSMTARVAQVVFTATQFPNVDRVAFWIDGAPVDALGGEGLVLTEPQRRMDMPRELSGSVIVDRPRPGETVTSPIRITGEGDVYEAQFPIEIWRDGVQIGGLAPVTAGAWGTWGDFDVEIPVDAEPGPIQIVTYDEGGCGTGPECPPIIRTVVDVVLG